MIVEDKCKHCGSIHKSVRVEKERIKDIVLAVYDLTENQINSKQRTKFLVEARFMLTYFLVKVYGHILTYKQISNVVGKNDHTYTVYAVKQISNWMETDETVKKKHDLINLCLNEIEDKILKVA